MGGAGNAHANRVRAVSARAGAGIGLSVIAVSNRRVSARNKNAEMLAVFSYAPVLQAELERVLHAPSLYDEFLRYLARAGHAVPAQCLERDFTQPHVRTPALLPMFEAIYRDPQTHWAAYALCEQLVDVEASFQLWRFRHMKTVERIIGHKRGTGGSSGVGFLSKALELTFFPELLDVRTLLG